MEATQEDSRAMNWHDRQGVLNVPIELVDEMPHLVAQCLAELRFCPLHVECRYDRREFVYRGLSPRFEIYRAGQELLRYDMHVRPRGDRKLLVVTLGDDPETLVEVEIDEVAP